MDDKFAEKLDQLLASDPELKKVYDWVVSITDIDESTVAEVDVIEIGGVEYFIFKEFIIRGTTYCHLVNVDDPMDSMYRKLSVEDGEEYLVPLDSDREFDMVTAYEQKYILRDLKRKQELDEESGEK